MHSDRRPLKTGAIEELDVEDAPFLGADAVTKGEGIYQNHRQRIRECARIRLLVTPASVLLGIMTLALFMLGLVPTSRRSGTLTNVQISDEITPLPKHRDTSEYVLSPSEYLGAPSAEREYHWTISDAVFNPDGVFRPMMLINNQFPGPLIECNEGDTLIVHVRNIARNATAIHWHGIFQNGTNSMDGTVGVTQCPIATNQSFTYRFTVTRQSGTFWYHGHHSAQATDGLVGPLVIHPRSRAHPDELSYDSDRVVMIQDHYHNTSAELLMDYLQSDKENEEPVPDSGLINGRTYRSCDEFEGWDCRHERSHLASLETLHLEAGKNHRLRFINTGAFAEFQVELDEHPMYITEVDGTATRPEPFDRINILPAQRYSAIVTTNATTGSSFWLRGRMVTHCFAVENPRLESEVRALVSYSTGQTSVQAADEAIIQEPRSKAWSEQLDLVCRDLNTTALKPLDVQPAPPSTASIFLRANFEIGAWRLSRGKLNSSSWQGNVTSPTLHRLVDAPRPLSSSSSLNEPPFVINDALFSRNTELVYETRGIQTLTIVLSNFDDGAHPFHLHGHQFFVLKSSPSGYPPATPEELEAQLVRDGALENPLRRDTVTLEAYGWVAIRVVLDNPGVWAFHCHNTWHAEAGMMMAFAARVDEVELWDKGESGRGLCAAEGVGRGMRPSDDIWEGNFGR